MVTIEEVNEPHNRVEGGEWYVGSGVQNRVEGGLVGTHKRDLIMLYLFSYLGIRRTARATPYKYTPTH